MDDCERGYPTLTPRWTGGGGDGDNNQQPVLRHAVEVPAHSFHQVSPWVAVTPPINAMAEKLESLWLTALLRARFVTAHTLGRGQLLPPVGETGSG